MSAPRAGWREPMVWLLLAIPAATVVGGLQTLRIARAGGQDAEPRDVRRTMQAQVVDLAPDARAATLRLAATVRVDADGHVRVALARRDDGVALRLQLVHPTRADADLAWSRRVGEPRWRGPLLPPGSRGRWILEDPADGWRLVGHWPAEGGVAVLQPAVAAP